jgi:hypothetical protein
LLEYVVGIANGRFLPEANANVRSQKKAKQSSFFGLNFKRLKDNYQQIAYQLVVHENTSSKPPYNQTNSGSNNAYGQSLPSYHFNNVSQSLKREHDPGNGNNPCSGTRPAPSNGDLQPRSKLQEIQLLLNKYYPPNHVNQFFELVAYMGILGNHEYIDKLLAFLRTIDQQVFNYGNIFGKLANSAEDNTSMLHYVVDLTLLQQTLDKDIKHKTSPEHYLQGKATLAAIEQLLSPYYPHEFVRNVITCLTKEFDATGDLSSLNTSFENHLKNVQRQTLY